MFDGRMPDPKPTDIPESTLLPCPFCGSNDIDPEGWANSEGVHGPACNFCGASAGSISDTDAENVAAWNQRTPAASPVAPPESMDELASNIANEMLDNLRHNVGQQRAKLASPVAGGSADESVTNCNGLVASRITEIASRLAAATPGPWASKGMTVEGPRYSHTSEGTGTTMHYRGHFTIGNHWASKEQRCIDAAFIAAAPEDIAYLLKLVPEGWVKVTPETKAQEFYIVTTAHEALWPRGVLLFWAANRSGYATFLEQAGRYSEEEARSICRMRGGADFMVPCEVIEAEAVRVVDVDKLKQFSPAAEEERSSL